MSGFRVRVDLSRFFSDERAHCWAVVGGGGGGVGGAVRGLQARLAELCGGALRRRRFLLLSDGHWLPEDEDLAVVQPGDRIVAIPLDKEWDVNSNEKVYETIPNSKVTAVEDALDHAPPNKKQKTNPRLGVDVDVNNTMYKETTRNKKKKSQLSNSAASHEDCPDWTEHTVTEKSIRKKKRSYKERDESVQTTSTPLAVESQTKLIAVCKSKHHKVFHEVDEVDTSSHVICDSSRGDATNDIADEIDIRNGAECRGDEQCLRNGDATELSSEDHEVVKTSELEAMKRRALQLLERVAPSPPEPCPSPPAPRASPPAPRASPPAPRASPPASRRRRVRRRRPRLNNSYLDMTDNTDSACSPPPAAPGSGGGGGGESGGGGGSGGVVRNASAERRAPRLVRPLPPPAAAAASPAPPAPATSYPDVAAARFLPPNTNGLPETPTSPLSQYLDEKYVN